jgi:hypothetical protein
VARGQKKIPGLLEGRGLRWIPEALEVSGLTINPNRNVAFGSRALAANNSRASSADSASTHHCSTRLTWTVAWKVLSSGFCFHVGGTLLTF